MGSRDNAVGSRNGALIMGSRDNAVSNYGKQG